VKVNSRGQRPRKGQSRPWHDPEGVEPLLDPFRVRCSYRISSVGVAHGY